MALSRYNYLEYELPKKWCSEEDEDCLLIYNPNGEGAMVLSFFSIVQPLKSLDDQVRDMAINFVSKNKIVLSAPLVAYGSKETKLVLCGSGTTPENDFIKLWLVAKHPKIVFATYNSDEPNHESKVCDIIIDSMNFKF